MSVWPPSKQAGWLGAGPFRETFKSEGCRAMRLVERRLDGWFRQSSLQAVLSVLQWVSALCIRSTRFLIRLMARQEDAVNLAQLTEEECRFDRFSCNERIWMDLMPS